MKCRCGRLQEMREAVCAPGLRPQPAQGTLTQCGDPFIVHSLRSACSSPEGGDTVTAQVTSAPGLSKALSNLFLSLNKWKWTKDQKHGYNGRKVARELPMLKLCNWRKVHSIGPGGLLGARRCTACHRGHSQKQQSAVPTKLEGKDKQGASRTFILKEQCKI